jgi:hypothetical protein
VSEVKPMSISKAMHQLKQELCPRWCTATDVVRSPLVRSALEHSPNNWHDPCTTDSSSIHWRAN